MRDLKIKFGDARDNAKQSISVNVNQVEKTGANLEEVGQLLAELLTAARREGLPEAARKELAQETTVIEEEAKRKEPAIDRIEGALKRITAILTTVGSFGGAVVATIGKIRHLFGLG
jgi:hypothetical protein